MGLLRKRLGKRNNHLSPIKTPWKLNLFRANTHWTPSDSHVFELRGSRCWFWCWFHLLILLNLNEIGGLFDHVEDGRTHGNEICLNNIPSRRKSDDCLNRPTLFCAHCVPQEGGRMPGWESVFWRGLLVFGNLKDSNKWLAEIPKIPCRSKISQKVSTFFKIMFDSVGFTYVLIFWKMIVQKYQDSTPEQFFENARRYQVFWTHHISKKN